MDQTQPPATNIQPAEVMSQNLPNHSSSSTIPAKKSLNVGMIVLVGTVVLLVGVSGYLVYQNRLMQAELSRVMVGPSPMPTVALIATTTPTPVDIDWETYASVNGEFSIKYPMGLDMTKGFDADPASIKLVYLGAAQRASGKTQASMTDGYVVAISKATLGKDKDLLGYATKAHDADASGCVDGRGEVGKVAPEKFVGRDGYMYAYTNCYAADGSVHYVQSGDVVYAVALTYVGSAENKRVYQKFAEQIVSTFKLLK